MIKLFMGWASLSGLGAGASMVLLMDPNMMANLVYEYWVGWDQIEALDLPVQGVGLSS